MEIDVEDLCHRFLWCETSVAAELEVGDLAVDLSVGEGPDVGGCFALDVFEVEGDGCAELERAGLTWRASIHFPAAIEPAREARDDLRPWR